MGDKDASTPRVYLARHGETEWTINGRYTGTTELLLTPNGRTQVLSSGKLLLGTGKLIDPAKLAHVFISPRKRAQETFDLLFDGEDGAEAGERKRVELAREGVLKGKVTTTEALAEWDYGDYEGFVTKEIRELRAKRGLDKDGQWDIWRDGCEGGESAQQVTDRLDGLIQTIHAIQGPCMHGEKPADVVLVAHGHLLRAFAKRWLKYPMEFPLSMMMEPGGIGILSYQHHNIEEPAFLLGIGFK